MTRQPGTRPASVIKMSASALCLAATLLAAACGTSAPSDYPAFNLTNAPDEGPGETP